MKGLLGIFFLVTAIFTSTGASADDHATAPVPVEFWGCTFNDGYDMDKLMSWYESWNKHIDGFKDQSYNAYVMTPMFSSEMTRVDFVAAGSWGSLASMGAGLQEFFGDGKGTELFAEFQEISTCTSHTLFMSQQMRAAKD
jgi:hypothetical protein